MPAFWVSPLRDIHGFLRRYFTLAGTIALGCVAASLIADQADTYALSSLSEGAPHLCTLFTLFVVLALYVMLDHSKKREVADMQAAHGG